jgi:hypothetical protein
MTHSNHRIYGPNRGEYYDIRYLGRGRWRVHSTHGWIVEVCGWNGIRYEEVATEAVRVFRGIAQGRVISAGDKRS